LTLSIINSELSIIVLNKKSVLISIAATDETKLNIVANIVLVMCSRVLSHAGRVRLPLAAHLECSLHVRIKPVRIVYPYGPVKLTPDLTARWATAHA
jgi:phenylalanyl-tRNA synthetase beta chain